MKTLSILASEYLQARQNRLAWNTQQLMKRAFKHLIGCCGDIPLDFFTEEHAEKFQNYLIDTYSKPTANIYIKSLRSVFRWAMRRKWIKNDVFGIPLAKPTQYKMRIYTSVEVQAILDAAKLLWRGRILLARTSGLRRSEALNLTISDIDYEQGLIHIQPKTDTRDSWAWEPKGRRSRTVSLTEETANVLAEIQNELPTGHTYPMLTELRYWRVIQMKRKGELSERIRLCPDENFATPFRRILKRAKVALGTFHDLRKTCLTDLADKGYPIHWLQKFAGHSSHITTMKYYVHVDEKKYLSQAKRLIGVTRFERATPAPPAPCSAKLSYTPNVPLTSSHNDFQL